MIDVRHFTAFAATMAHVQTAVTERHQVNVAPDESGWTVAVVSRPAVKQQERGKDD